MKSNTLAINRRIPLPLGMGITNGEFDIRHIAYAGSTERFFLCTPKYIVFFDHNCDNIEKAYCSMGVAADDCTVFSVETERNYKDNYRFLKIGLIDARKGKLEQVPIPWEIRIIKTITMLPFGRFSKLFITTEHGLHLMDHTDGQWRKRDFIPVEKFLYDYRNLENPFIGLFHPKGEIYGCRGTKGGMNLLVFSVDQQKQTGEYFLESRDGIIIKTEIVHDHSAIVLHKQIDKETYLQFYDFRNSTLLFTSPKPVANHAFHMSDRFFILAYTDNTLELFTYPEFGSAGYTDIFSFSPAEKLMFGTGLSQQTILVVSDDEAIEFAW